MRAKLVLTLIVLAFALSASLGRHSASAASASPGGITVSPAFQMVTVASGTAEQPIEFSITNNQPAPQDLSFAARDFNTLNESGGLFFVGTNPTALQQKYGLAKWISLPSTRLIILPHQTIKFNASILNLPDMAEGGHYGALMISLNNGKAAGGQVGLEPIATSLLFVTKLGGDTHKLNLSSVSFSRSLFTLPQDVVVRFHNDGNTHLIPRGSVTLTAPGGKIISKGIINGDSGIILPETFRKYDIPLQHINNSSAVGKYTIHVDFRFDGLDQFRSYQKSFLIVPAWILVTAAGLLFLAFVMLVLLLKRRTALTHKSTKIKVQHL